MNEKPIRVFFVCTGNACRSQMAEALLRRSGGERFDVHSAGMVASGVFPMTIEVLAEIGIDARGQRSKTWEVYRDAPPFDFVVTLCDYAAQFCPAFAGERRRMHWSVHDPAGATGTAEERREVFRRVRDDLARRIGEFVQQTRGDREGRQR
jgi:arsenate reductase